MDIIGKPGRPKGTGKNKAKRISGTGYTVNEASQLKYKRQSPDGTWEIDTDAINTAIERYITACKEDGKPMSISGLMIALGIRSRSTLLLWQSGYTSEAMRDDGDVVYNHALSEAVAQGVLAVAQYFEERNDKYSTQKDIMALKTLGIYADQQVDVKVSGSIQTGKWGKWGK